MLSVSEAASMGLTFEIGVEVAYYYNFGPSLTGIMTAMSLGLMNLRLDLGMLRTGGGVEVNFLSSGNAGYLFIFINFV
jgi:hypothetical protein